MFEKSKNPSSYVLVSTRKKENPHPHPHARARRFEANHNATKRPRIIPATEPRLIIFPETAALEPVVLGAEVLADPVLELEPETEPEELGGAVEVVPKPDELLVGVPEVLEPLTLVVVLGALTLPDDTAEEVELTELLEVAAISNGGV